VQPTGAEVAHAPRAEGAHQVLPEELDVPLEHVVGGPAEVPVEETFAMPNLDLAPHAPVELAPDSLVS